MLNTPTCPQPAALLCDFPHHFHSTGGNVIIIDSFGYRWDLQLHLCKWIYSTLIFLMGLFDKYSLNKVALATFYIQSVGLLEFRGPQWTNLWRLRNQQVLSLVIIMEQWENDLRNTSCTPFKCIQIYTKQTFEYIFSLIRFFWFGGLLSEISRTFLVN